jgi:8-oxo-dGTP pyrophosphatase MutT (NUDIX family)
MSDEPRLQSGIIPYRRKPSGRIEILLITSRQTGEWQVPKGNLEPGLSERESAVKEGWEEAGVKGTPGEAAVGSYTYRRGTERRRVQLYPLEVLQIEDSWPEKDQRQRRWVVGDEAIGEVENAGLREVLRRFLEDVG